MKLEGSVALVTGANRGLGKALVAALVEAGAAKRGSTGSPPTPASTRSRAASTRSACCRTSWGRPARRCRRAPATDVAWLEPYPDSNLEGIAEAAPTPEARYSSRESVQAATAAAPAAPRRTFRRGKRMMRTASGCSSRRTRASSCLRGSSGTWGARPSGPSSGRSGRPVAASAWCRPRPTGSPRSPFMNAAPTGALPRTPSRCSRSRGTRFPP
jgi:hypothetical protein